MFVRGVTLAAASAVSGGKLPAELMNGRGTGPHHARRDPAALVRSMISRSRDNDSFPDLASIMSGMDYVFSALIYAQLIWSGKL
jgi:hypothetical protein